MEKFDKTQYVFMIKMLSEVCIEELYLNIVKVMYDKCTANKDEKI